jgi:hypothetical protein
MGPEDFKHKSHKKENTDKNWITNKNHPYQGNAGTQA